MNDPRPIRLQPVPPPDPTDERLGVPCRRPTCANTVERGPVGRPPAFCTKNCQQIYRRERDRAQRELRDAIDVAEAYDVDTSSSIPQPTSTRHQPNQTATAAPSPTGQPTAPPSTALIDPLHNISLAIAELESSPQDPTRTTRAIDRLRRARDLMYAALADADNP